MYQWPRRLLLMVGRRYAAPAGVNPGHKDKEASS
jgi:hypothetical protein